AAVVVTATSLRNWAQQRLFRGRTSDLFEHGNGALAATRSCRLVLTNSIIIPYLSTFLLGACAEDVDGVAAFTESHVGALGGLTYAETGAGALALALTVNGVNGVD